MVQACSAELTIEELKFLRYSHIWACASHVVSLNNQTTSTIVSEISIE